MSAIHTALLKYFGYKKFRPGQEEIINSIITGNNVLAVLPTGAGKSICYQIPSIVGKSFSLVISPLIALMKDQVDSLNAKETIAAFINSSLDYNETEMILNETENGKYKLLYVAPERLENLTFAERIKRMNPSYLFVDEAHCISEWGHNFRPSYRKIKEFIDFAEIKSISAFTATATPEVEKDIVFQLGLKDPKVFVRGFDRENLLINVIQTKQKKEKTLEFVSKYGTPAIIYTASRKKAEEISEYLNLHKIKCSYYHAGLSSIERKHVQESFLNDKVPVIAATNAFGMGIDKKDIRLIVHFNAPGSIEAYYQEIGRAGRDGKVSNTFLLYDESDIDLQEFLIATSNPDIKTVQNIYEAILDYKRISIGTKPEQEIEIDNDFLTLVLRRQIPKGILKASLKILENAGYLREVSNYEKKYQVQFLFETNKLKEFVKNTSSTNFREIILFLLRKTGGVIFTKKMQIDLTSLSNEINLPESIIDDTLRSLDDLGILSYYVPPVKDSVFVTHPRVDVKYLKLDMSSVNENYYHQMKKLDSVKQFVNSAGCRFKFILNYFGDEEDYQRCGRCDNCNENDSSTIEQYNYLSEIILRTMHEFNSGIAYNAVINSLKGKSKDIHLQKLSTFGSCHNYKSNELTKIFFDLIEKHLITKIDTLRDKYIVSDKGISYLKSKGIIEEKTIEAENYEENLLLFHKLREVRAAMAKRFMQSERIICPDEILRAVVFKKPKTRRELLAVEGFNERMYNKIGESLLEAVAEFTKLLKYSVNNSSKKDMDLNVNTDLQAQNVLPKNIFDTFKLLKKGYNIKDIAATRKLSEAVISMQIESILSYLPDTSIDNLIDENSLQLIFKEIEKGFYDLKDIKSRLPENITYPIIRIAIAKKKAK
jgi:ATP-dependent DNA helicase, RecQ family